MDHLELNGTLMLAQAVNLEGSSIIELRNDSVISGLSLLTYLNMRSVGLKQIHPGSFDHHLLRAIDLSDNKDLEIPNDAFASLPVLEALNLPAHLSSKLCNFTLNAVNCSLFDEFSGDYVPSIFIEGVKQTNIHCLCKYENYSRRGFCIPGGRAYAAGMKHPPSVWVIVCALLAALVGPVFTR
jgi:hypothetical protein